MNLEIIHKTKHNFCLSQQHDLKSVPDKNASCHKIMFSPCLFTLNVGINYKWHKYQYSWNLRGITMLLYTICWSYSWIILLLKYSVISFSSFAICENEPYNLQFLVLDEIWLSFYQVFREHDQYPWHIFFLIFKIGKILLFIILSKFVCLYYYYLFHFIFNTQFFWGKKLKFNFK
jgi:hypothetical protein